MRTRRFLKRQIRTRRLRKGKMRIGRRTSIHKKGGTNSNRKKQTIRNFLKREKTHNVVSVIKKKLKKQDALNEKEIMFFCNEKSPFKTDQRLKKKYTPLLDINIRYIIQDYDFQFEQKEKEYDDMYKKIKKDKVEDYILTENETEIMNILESEINAIINKKKIYNDLYKFCIPQQKKLISSSLRESSSPRKSVKNVLLVGSNPAKSNLSINPDYFDELNGRLLEPMYKSITPKNALPSSILKSYHSSQRSEDSIVNPSNIDLFNR
jgi:hypothetical protein